MTKISNVITILFMFGLMCSCTLITKNFNEMTENEFQIAEREIYLITKISSREIFSQDIVLKEQVASLLNSMNDQMDEYIQNGEFFDKLLSNIQDPEMKELIELLTLEISKYGGFTYIDISQTALDARSVRILMEVVEGIKDAANE